MIALVAVVLVFHRSSVSSVSQDRTTSRTRYIHSAVQLGYLRHISVWIVNEVMISYKEHYPFPVVILKCVSHTLWCSNKNHLSTVSTIMMILSS